MFFWLIMLVLVAVLVAVMPLDAQVRKTFNIIIIALAIFVVIFWLLPLAGTDIPWDWPRRR